MKNFSLLVFLSILLSACDGGSSDGTGGNTPESNTPPVDSRERFSYFLERAQKGDVVATWEVASAYLYGRGVDRDPSEGMKLTRTAAAQGNTDALFQMYSVYRNGLVGDYGMVGEIDESKAEQYQQLFVDSLIASAEAEDEKFNPDYAISLSRFYGYGAFGVDEDLIKAKAYADKGMSRLLELAEGNDSHAMIQLSIIYNDGYAFQLEDKEKGIYWAQRAAETNDPAGAMQLAEVYEDSDPDLYLNYVLKAANSGYLPAIMYFVYARRDYADTESALTWSLKAYDQQADGMVARIISDLYKELGDAERSMDWALKSLHDDNSASLAGHFFGAFEAIKSFYIPEDNIWGSEESSAAITRMFSSVHYHEFYRRFQELASLCDRVEGLEKAGYCGISKNIDNYSQPQ